MANLTSLKTPGVYIDEKRLFPPSVAQVETAIPAFIGHTKKAKKVAEDLTLKPTRISSLLEYTEMFGGPQKEENIIVTEEDVNGKLIFTADFDWDGKGPSKHLMYYAMQQYFANGGGPCYIISVGTYLELGLTITNTKENNDDEGIFLRALSELRKFDEPTLIVFPESQGMDSGTYQLLYAEALNQCNELKDRFVIIDMPESGRTLRMAGEVLQAASDFRAIEIGGPDELKYGATYFPNIRSVFDYSYDEEKLVITIGGENKTFAELDNSQKANVKLAISNMSIYLTPSASVAGVYARVDSNRGVWKAPANEGILSINGLTYKVNDQLQDSLNIDTDGGKSVNAIREFAGRGIKIWGARTLTGNDNEWRYISVRRFFNMVEESVKKATVQFVFEPNDVNTWVKVRAMIENFLILQWRAGALAGAVPEDAFYVNVGLGKTMTALDILEGRMIVEIGMAAVRPAEFIILRFSHKMQES